jgi:uracil-DNA glycosylase family 4
VPPKKTSLPVIDYATDANYSVDKQESGFKGMPCQGCELQPKKRLCGSGANGGVDIMLVSESPSQWSVNNHEVFYGRGGRVIRAAWRNLTELDDANGGAIGIRKLRRWDTYAVQCQVEEGREQESASKSVIQRCKGYLHSAIANKKPKVILAFGATALKALEYHGSNFTEARGRVLDMTISGQAVKVIPTFSTRHVQAKTGLYNLFYADFIRAVRLASGKDQAEAETTLEEITKDYRIPKTVDEVKTLCDDIITYAVPGKAASSCALAVDTETNTVNPHRTDAKVLCVSFAWDTGMAAAIPLFHDQAPWSPGELDEVVGHVRRVLECQKPKALHHGKFDVKMLELRHGWRVNNVMWDTMLGEHLLREDMSGSYGLKTLGRSYFPAFGSYADKIHELAEKLTPDEEGVAATLTGVRKGKIPSTVEGVEEGLTCDMTKAELEKYAFGTKRDRKKKTMDAGYERVPIDTLLTYAAVDTDLTRRLMRHQFARMQGEHYTHARTLMASHCIPGMRVLGKMEFGGMRVDRDYLEKSEIDLAKVVEEKHAILLEHWKGSGEFNPNSTANVADVLFNSGAIDRATGKRVPRTGPWVEKNKKSGQNKTDKKTLKAIAEHTGCEFARSLLEYRAAHKALTGFLAEIKFLSEYDGYLHTNFHQHGTSTGRLSSSGVNMQNLGSWMAGVNIKRIFVPDDAEEELIFNVDWKGAEIRVFTAYAPDQSLIDALNGGLDVHSWFTQEIFGIPYDEVEAKKETDKEMKTTRTTVKRVVFGILYGAMARKIAETAGVSEKRAQEIIDKLFARFPSLENYMDEVVMQIHDKGFVETLFGRRRRFPLQNVNGFFRGQAERRGKNMKIQSTSSDIVIGQLVEMGEHIHELGGRLCITVHDSIVGTIKKKYLDQAEGFFNYYCVQRVREKYPWLPVDFAHDISVGPTYGDTIPLADYLKQQNPPALSDAQAFEVGMDIESINELREEEEEGGVALSTLSQRVN